METGEAQNPTTAGPGASIVILVYGSNHRHAPLVQAALADGFPPERVTVVYNPSAEGGAPPSTPDGVRVLVMPRNLGYGGAMNAAIASASGDVLILCTDDTRPDPGVLADLAALARATPGIYGPVLVRPDGTAFSFGGTLEAGGDLARHRQSPGGEALLEAAWIDGAIMAFHRVVLEEVGGFDDQFFLYAEDVDWCERARRAGFPVAVASELRAVTAPGAEDRKAAFEYYSTRNGLRRARKTGGRRAVLARLLRELRRTAARLVKRMDGPPGRTIARARILGLWHGLRGRGGEAPRRIAT